MQLHDKVFVVTRADGSTASSTSPAFIQPFVRFADLETAQIERVLAVNLGV